MMTKLRKFVDQPYGGGRVIPAPFVGKIAAAERGQRATWAKGSSMRKSVGTRSVILSNVHIRKTYPLNENSDLHSIV